MTTKLSYIYTILSLFLFIQCKQEKAKENIQSQNTSTIKYAKGFDIIEENGNKYLLIKKVFQNEISSFKYLLSEKNDFNNNEIKVPVNRLVVTSTTHIPMIELLGAEDRIIGFPNTKYISSEKTRKRIEDGLITELGSEQSMNTEILIDLVPDLVVGFSLHPNNKLYNNIKKLGFPVIFNGEWLEETPLGRAEWIKFFGVLLGKEKEAQTVFETIEKDYLAVKKIAQSVDKSPKIMSGSFFKDIWYAPAGESFIGKFLADANLDYLWKDSKGTGSIQLNFENVLEKAQEAEYWIGCGIHETKSQLLSTNKNFDQFTPLKTNKTYTIGAVKGKSGGIKYFEFAPIRPDLILKDLIKITNPELLPDYQLSFYRLVE
ncbi:ABC transporter substrate-binding protein [uncultured Tenacibaculum sp.]|uniref:ABC transporter substrate-binding protein n=1 Tax=uncultured Tenacibaculum sp. TaxID=174713 RepID=UPI0026022F5C|nr:ABC transporter substrate-binding protein [uncultured Tenacibaculum sp.]